MPENRGVPGRVRVSRLEEGPHLRAFLWVGRTHSWRASAALDRISGSETALASRQGDDEGNHGGGR
jgi:hypothetical protein